MDRKLKVGVIGVGIQGSSHIKVYQSLHNVELIAVADIDAEKLKTVADKNNIPGRYTDYHEMLRREPIEAVSVVIPDPLHRDPVLAAAAAGKHILCEKPLATTVADAETMLAAVRKAGVKLMVNLSNRWMPYMSMTKEAVQKGDLGEPLYAYARLSNTLFVPTKMIAPWSASTTLPFWLMSHTIDRVRWIFGGDAKSVFAVSRSKVLKALGFNTPDLYAALVEFDNGAVGNFESVWVLPESRPSIVDSKMELVFTKGSVTVDQQQTTIAMATKDKYSLPGTLQADIYGAPVGFVTESIRHFVDCCLTDRQPWVSGEDGLHLVRICAAIEESTRTGERVDL
jgi:predicted dehydrogenase